MRIRKRPTIRRRLVKVLCAGIIVLFVVATLYLERSLRRNPPSWRGDDIQPTERPSRRRQHSVVSAHQQQMITVFLRQPGNEVLTNQELQSIARFVNELTQIHCKPNEDTRNALWTYLLTNVTREERINWLNPVMGTARSITLESAVPCHDDYWIPFGQFTTLPMHLHKVSRGTAVAKCNVPVIYTPNDCENTTKRCRSDGTLLCPSLMGLQHQGQPGDDCLVYTFGIATQWEFEDYAGKHCEVHAHDPTIKFKEAHEEHISAGVTFHYQGLGTKNGTAKDQTTESLYGELGGPIMTLGELRKHHGHEQRTISVLKVDCEGCEWESFNYLAVHEPDILNRVCTIVFEIHVSTTLQMSTPQQLKWMASFWNHFLEDRGFRFWYLHPNSGARRDRNVHPLLLDLGLDPGFCCFEMGLHRPGCT